MSRSNNTEITSPVKRYYEWVGSKGCLKYFDKTKGEKGENVEVALPFTFLVLDQLNTIKGFSDKDQSGFWANEVRDITREKLTVRNKKGVVATGLYKEMAAVLNMGAEYCKSVYIACKGADGKLEICNISMKGSSIGPWIDLCKGRDIYKSAITISGATAAKKGKTDYFIPQFTLKTVTPESDAAAIELDKELQEYLKAYFQRSNTQQVEEVSNQAATQSRSNDFSELNTELAGDADRSGPSGDINTPVDDLPF
jgi:hypothetical protein